MEVSRDMAEKILEVDDLKINFNTYNGSVQAIRDVSFDLYKGETLAIVGESGSGKSVTTRSLMGLLAKNARVEKGSITFKVEEIIGKSEAQMVKIRGSVSEMILQYQKKSMHP